MLSEAYWNARLNSNYINGDVDQNDKLNFYGWGKVAEEFDVNDPKAAPGLFDVKGKYMYNSWKKFVDEGLDAETAEKNYIALYDGLFAKYGLRVPGPKEKEENEKKVKKARVRMEEIEQKKEEEKKKKEASGEASSADA